MEDCIPSSQTVGQEIEEKELTEHIDRWLRSLDQADRIMFVRRYWNGVALRDLVNEQGITPEKMSQRMYRLRIGLKTALEKEGIHL